MIQIYTRINIQEIVQMPGFNVAPMGGGYSAAGPSNITETRRVNRWVFETLGRGRGTFSQAELLLLQSANRPAFSYDPVEMHHNQEIARFAGKQDWEPINLKWYDAEQNPDVSRGLYHWLETVTNMASVRVAHPANYKRTGSLAMLDGTGQATERWSLYGTWPESVNWGELTYVEGNISLIEAVLRYDRAVRECVALPIPQPIAPSCP